MLVYRSSHRPAIYRAQQSASVRLGTREPSGFLEGPAWGRRARGVDAHYKSPATEPGLRGCTGEYAVGVRRIGDGVGSASPHVGWVRGNSVIRPVPARQEVCGRFRPNSAFPIPIPAASINRKACPRPAR